MTRLMALALAVLLASTFHIEANAEQSWVNEIRKGKGRASLEAVCKKLEQLRKMEKPSQELSLAAAKALLRVFDIPRVIRASVAGCSVGTENRIRFDDGISVMDMLVAVLDRADLKPKDISPATTPASLRTVLLNDLRSNIWSARNGIKAGRLNQSEGHALIRSLAERAVKNWDFTPEELGLTAREINELQWR